MTETPESPVEPASQDSGPAKTGRFRWTAVLAVAALVGLAVWLIVDTVGGDGSSTPSTATESPVALSANGLATLAQAGGSPIYWVGPKEGSMYELSQQSGQVYVRYLPSGVEAGDPQSLLTVATYAVADAYDVTSRTAGVDTEIVVIPGGGVAALSTSRPTSAYVAFPGVDYQIEIYDPDPAVVRKLAMSGAVQPVPPPEAAVTPRGPEAVSEDDLVSLSEELGHPVYWAGLREKMTYELTVTAEAAVFVRYLPKGTDVGASGGALTVATYPVAGAYDVTKKGSSGTDSVVVKAPGGGIAVHPKGNSKNVHLAYPGEDVQVEVYSPVPGVAPKLVSQGKIVPVG